MIIVIRPEVQKTCLDIRQLGCEVPNADTSGWTVTISRRGCPEPIVCMCQPACFVDMPKRNQCLPEPAAVCGEGTAKVIEYDSFDNTEPGRLCFYWDKLLHEQPSGRYDAVVTDKNGCEMTCFQLHIPKRKFVVTDYENFNANC